MLSITEALFLTLKKLKTFRPNSRKLAKEIKV